MYYQSSILTYNLFVEPPIEADILPENTGDTDDPENKPEEPVQADEIVNNEATEPSEKPSEIVEVPTENGLSENGTEEPKTEAALKPIQPPPQPLPPLAINGSSSRRNSSSSKSNSSSRRNSHANGMETFLKTGKMDVEASHGPKKPPFGRRLSNSSVKTNASNKTGSAGSRKSGKLPAI